MLSGELIRRRPEGLPDHTIFMQMEGTGGQSFGAFLAPASRCT
jgi:glutamate synthase (NADPH/NADH) large chain